MFDKIKGLFASRQASAEQSFDNPDKRREQETYEQWGIRICGKVGGNLNALTPFLQKVYLAIYQEQAENNDLQQQERAKIEVEIEQCNNNIEALNTTIENANKHIQEAKARETELKKEKEEIKNSKEQVNKEQRLKLIIGLCIIIPLTFYLFLFYSSTFYSAFFRDVNTMSGLANAMFDPQALTNAINNSFIEFCFVLSAPIIFLGLGFCLHFFSIQKNNNKYLKMAVLVLITFSFDCILAFLIGKQLHEFGKIIGTIPLDENYTAALALQDINTWAVIFCGFIVYIIWGIIFDMIMTAHNDMDLNKIRTRTIDLELEELKQNINDEKTGITNTQNDITNIRNNLAALKKKLDNKTFINTSIIQREMNNFFAGWIIQMSTLSISHEQQQQAREIFDNMENSLINKKI